MQTTRCDPLHHTSAMADNISPVPCQKELHKAAKRMRLETDHVSEDSVHSCSEDSISVPLSSKEMFWDPDHPSKVLEGLNRLRLNGTLCDVILCCEGEQFPCHRYVLASFSSYFEAMFTSGMRESTQERVTISGVEPHIIGMMVNYAYTSKVSISTANVQALLAASNLWDVTAVRNACCDFMASHMDANNCLGIYCFAVDHSCEELKTNSMDYILEHFSHSGIYQRQEFLSLPVERLTEILASDLNVPNEDMVFEAAMLWLDKCPTRRQSFEKVLEQIRLPLISPSYLPTVIESLDVVKEYQGCQRFISEAKGERPYSNTARPRMTTVIAMLGAKAQRACTVESFDPLNNQWKTLGRLPLKVYQPAVVASGSMCNMYVADGDGYYRYIWAFSVHRNSWLEMEEMERQARTAKSLVVLDGCVFVVFGREKEKSTISMQRYNSNTETWQVMKCDGVAATDKTPIVVTLDGCLYFIGDAPIQPKRTQMYKYHPVRSEWKKVTPMQMPRDQSAACVLNGKIYVTGGYSMKYERNRPCKIIQNAVECYNDKTKQWTMCAPMQEPRYKHSAVVVDGKIYVLGGKGNDKSYTQNIERYCEETDTWETVGKTPAGFYALRCVSLRLRNDHVPMVDDDDEADSVVTIEYEETDEDAENYEDEENDEDDESNEDNDSFDWSREYAPGTPINSEDSEEEYEDDY